MVIATVFLTIITMTIGFTLGERHRKNSQATDPTSPVTQDSVPPSAQPQPTPSGKPCPAETQGWSISQGYGPLAQRLMVKTASENAWICVNYRGDLFYQGYTHRERPLVQNDNGLFLAGVKNLGGNRYTVVSPDGNTFKVDRSELEIDYANGKPSEHHAVTASES